MIHRLRLFAALTVVAVVPAAWADDVPAGFKTGTPELKAAGALAFGPEGILFVADAPAGTIYAIATGDTKPAGTRIEGRELDGPSAGSSASPGPGGRQRHEGQPGQRQRHIRARGKPGPRPCWSRSGPTGSRAGPAEDVKYSSVKVNNTAGRGPAITSIVFHKGTCTSPG